MLDVPIKILHPKAKIPTKPVGDPDVAAYDLYTPTYFKLTPFERRVIPLGFAFEIPRGYYGHICDKSGHAAKRGIHVMGGIVDSSFRGEVGVVVINLNCVEWLQKMFFNVVRPDAQVMAIDKFFTPVGTWEVPEGTAIAQMVFKKCENVNFHPTDTLSETKRGEGGWGSTASQ